MSNWPLWLRPSNHLPMVLFAFYFTMHGNYGGRKHNNIIGWLLLQSEVNKYFLADKITFFM